MNYCQIINISLFISENRIINIQQKSKNGLSYYNCIFHLNTDYYIILIWNFNNTITHQQIQTNKNTFILYDRHGNALFIFT